MEGEEERSEHNRSFSKASIPKRITIVAAGALVNIIFGLVVYFILMTTLTPNIANETNIAEITIQNRITYAWRETTEFSISIIDNLKQLFTGNVGVDQMMGPVGISQVVSQTNGLKEFIYMLALISLSLGVTNLLPIPALDGGKIVLLIIEAIRRKPLKEKTEINFQLIGFSIIIALSLYITYNDVLKLF